MQTSPVSFSDLKLKAIASPSCSPARLKKVNSASSLIQFRNASIKEL
jgi:hypothetical protein